FVREVNSMPAWSGLQSVVAVNIADAIADALLKFLADRTEAAAARPSRLTAPANS
ncbi:MAG: RimK family alpha-L-glutamate ligase, partial [Mesorhizobium sp.]